MFAVLKNGFVFESDQQISEFRKSVFATILRVAAFFAPLFAALHYGGYIDISDFHAGADLLYGAVSLLILLRLKQKPDHYFYLAIAFICASYLLFVSAFIFAVNDQFRAVWFYLLIAATFVLLPRRWGDMFALLSVAAILVCYNLYPTGISLDAIVTSILAIFPFTLILRAYAKEGDGHILELSDKNQQLLELASRDELTKSFNRRMFYELGDHTYAMAKRDNKPLSLLFLDIDNFKSINDSYGHQVGDEVLIKFAQMCMSNQRESDVFARIGGEEFAMLLPNTDVNHALDLAERLLKTVNSNSCVIGETQIAITVSIGVAQMNETDNLLESVIRRADAALYQAKEAGRNQVKTLSA